jgi:hypothetical protein
MPTQASDASAPAGFRRPAPQARGPGRGPRIPGTGRKPAGVPWRGFCLRRLERVTRLALGPRPALRRFPEPPAGGKRALPAPSGTLPPKPPPRRRRRPCCHRPCRDSPKCQGCRKEWGKIAGWPRTRPPAPRRRPSRARPLSDASRSSPWPQDVCASRAVSACRKSPKTRWTPARCCYPSGRGATSSPRPLSRYLVSVHRPGQAGWTVTCLRCKRSRCPHGR